jgi:hypothetical protein
MDCVLQGTSLVQGSRIFTSSFCMWHFLLSRAAFLPLPPPTPSAPGCVEWASSGIPSAVLPLCPGRIEQGSLGYSLGRVPSYPVALLSLVLSAPPIEISCRTAWFSSCWLCACLPSSSLCDFLELDMELAAGIPRWTGRSCPVEAVGAGHFLQPYRGGRVTRALQHRCSHKDFSEDGFPEKAVLELRSGTE